MPTPQVATSENAPVGVEDTIRSVETLFRALTGKNPPAGENHQTPIPVEKDPAQYVNEQLDRLLSALARPDLVSGAPFGTFSPPMSVAESDTELVVVVDLPGVERGEIEVLIEGNVLSVRGRRAEEARAGKRSRLDERWRGPFARSLVLSPLARYGEPTARLRDGVLEIRVASEGIGGGARHNVSVS